MSTNKNRRPDTELFCILAKMSNVRLTNPQDLTANFQEIEKSMSTYWRIYSQQNPDDGKRDSSDCSVLVQKIIRKSKGEGRVRRPVD